jgi:hypothetical protein
MKHIKLQIPGGTHISRACSDAAKLARSKRAIVHLEFNGITLTASPKMSASTLLWCYETETNRRAFTLEAVRERKKLDAEHQAQVETSQAMVDMIVDHLPESVHDMDKLMDECARLAKYGDWIGVKIPFEKIIGILEGAGYSNNAHVGKPASEFTTRKMVGEWIAGQVINCLKSGMPPHPMTETFRDKYFALSNAVRER